MQTTCDYCKGLFEEGAFKCPNCGAPATADAASALDFRTCPYCCRRLLALASPACNFCGRRLPERYIKEREAQLRRMSEVDDTGIPSEAAMKADEVLFMTGRPARRSSSPFDLSDILDLTDLFSR